MEKETHFIYILVIAILLTVSYLTAKQRDELLEISPQEKQCYATYGTQATWDWECKTTIIHK